MGRKKQDPLESDKRQQIVKVAGRIFLEQAFSDVSMDALAEAVPVSKRTLYNHFDDKKALFLAVMQMRCAEMFDAIQRILSEDKRNPEETLTAMGEQFLDIVLKPDAISIYRVAITEALHFKDFGKLFYASGPVRLETVLSEYFVRQTKAGKLHIENPEMATGLFMGMLKNRLQFKCMMGLQKRVTTAERKAMARYAAQVFVRGHTKNS